MVGHGGSSAGSYLDDPTSPIPSHCASIVVTSTVRVNYVDPLVMGSIWKYFIKKKRIGRSIKRDSAISFVDTNVTVTPNMQRWPMLKDFSVSCNPFLTKLL